LIRSNGEAVPLTGAIDRVPVSRGDSIRLATSGGGGFGLASERDPAARQTDIDNGFVTDDAAPMGHAAE
jgi:N-methylhydantoinase B